MAYKSPFFSSSAFIHYEFKSLSTNFSLGTPTHLGVTLKGYEPLFKTPVICTTICHQAVWGEVGPGDR